MIIIQISHLGKPSQLASLSAADGTILWDVHLREDLVHYRLHLRREAFDHAVRERCGLLGCPHLAWRAA